MVTWRHVDSNDVALKLPESVMRLHYDVIESRRSRWDPAQTATFWGYKLQIRLKDRTRWEDVGYTFLTNDDAYHDSCRTPSVDKKRWDRDDIRTIINRANHILEELGYFPDEEDD